MTNKIVAVQGNNPSKLNPVTDTSVFLAHEIQNKNYKIFYYDPKDLSIINSKVIAVGCFIEFNYKNKKFFKIFSILLIFFLIFSSDKMVLVLFFPEGSPILVVPPPNKTIGR